ncbi:MAG: LysM domain-containing protein [Bdellovibrionales bacterium]|nr:LysM domain-containing protein [Bdellovibrionales bacterium]
MFDTQNPMNPNRDKHCIKFSAGAFLLGVIAVTLGCSSSPEKDDPYFESKKVAETELPPPAPISIPPTTQPEVPRVQAAPPAPSLPPPSEEVLPPPKEVAPKELPSKPDALAVDLKPAKGKTIRYKVKPGDTLWSIAERFLGDGNLFQELQEQNGLADPMKLEKDTELKITNPKMLKGKSPHAQGDPIE